MTIKGISLADLLDVIPQSCGLKIYIIRRDMDYEIIVYKPDEIVADDTFPFKLENILIELVEAGKPGYIDITCRII